jgi:ribokinase
MSMNAFVLANFIQVGCWFVPRLAQLSETVFANDVHFEPGGKGLNVMWGLHRLQALGTCMMGLGKDSYGDQAMSLLDQAGISNACVHRFDGHSGWGAGWVMPDGRYAGSVYLGANLKLSAQQVEAARERLVSSDLVYAQLETSLPAIERAFVLAHEAGVCTVLNPSPWQELPASVMNSTEILLVNEVEATALLGIEGNALSDISAYPDAKTVLDGVRPRLLSLWPRWRTLKRLVITLGERGSLSIEPAGTAQLAGAAQIQAVDSVGAGDAFASAYCWALMSGYQEQALRWGNAAGACVASQRGVLHAMPDKNHLSQQFEFTPQPDSVSL